MISKERVVLFHTLVAVSATHYLRRNPGRSGSLLTDATEKALALAGAWSDLDFANMLDALDQIRHDSKSTPPLEL